MNLALLDTNVLIHAAFQDAPLHACAARLLDRGMKERGVYCVAAQNLVEFSAVSTRPRLVASPLQPADLNRMVTRMYRSRLLQKIYPKRAAVMRALREGVSLGFSGPAWYDLFLAVTMQEAKVFSIVTEDLKTFRRIPFVEPISIEDAVASMS